LCATGTDRCAYLQPPQNEFDHEPDHADGDDGDGRVHRRCRSKINKPVIGNDGEHGHGKGHQDEIADDHAALAGRSALWCMT